jgi:hypothetical protein
MMDWPPHPTTTHKPYRWELHPTRLNQYAHWFQSEQEKDRDDNTIFWTPLLSCKDQSCCFWNTCYNCYDCNDCPITLLVVDKAEFMARK